MDQSTNLKALAVILIISLGLGWATAEDASLRDDSDATIEDAPTDYCDASGGNTEYISRVKIGSIDNSTGYTAGGYADYTAISTVIRLSQSYNITVTNGDPIYPRDQCGIWIDWNQNLDFDDAGEAIIMAGSPGVGPYTATITQPPGALPGDTRMRVRIMFTGTLDPCGATDYGEVEDYTITVMDCTFPPAPVDPDPGNIATDVPTDTSLEWNTVGKKSSSGIDGSAKPAYSDEEAIESPAGPEVLYAAATTTDYNFGTLDRASGLFLAIGTTSEQMQAMAYDRNTDTVYATTFSDAKLVTIDQATGALTIIGPTGASNMHGLAFDPTTNTLYAMDAGSDSQLYTINTSTGVATPIGSPVVGATVGGLAFDPGSNTLYGIDNFAPQSKLITVNTTTGTHTVVGPLGAGIVDVDALAFSEPEGKLYAIDDTTENLLSINPATGAATVIGSTGDVWGSTYGMTCKSGPCQITYDVYFGTTNPPTNLICSDTSETTCDPGPLQPCTLYYWRVIAKNCCGQSYGGIWSFVTADCQCQCWGDVSDGLMVPPGDGTTVDFGDLNYLIGQLAANGWSISLADRPDLACADVADGLILPPGDGTTVDFGDLGYLIGQLAANGWSMGCMP